MPDTSALQALYSALIQGGATILAILGAFLLTFGAGQSSEPDEVPHKRYQKIVAFSHTAVTLFVLVLFCVTGPATLLAWLPNDRVPCLRSVVAITA